MKNTSFPPRFERLIDNGGLVGAVPSITKSGRPKGGVYGTRLKEIIEALRASAGDGAFRLGPVATNREAGALRCSLMHAARQTGVDKEVRFFQRTVEEGKFVYVALATEDRF